MNSKTVRWYALKVFYNKVLAVRSQLEADGIETYVAMHPVERVVRGKIVMEDKPLINSLLFLRCSAERLKLYKKAHNGELLYYQDFATGEPAPVDEREMRSFIILTSVDRGTRVQYLGDSVPDFRRGERVRVTGGLYEGAEGYIKKVRSDRKLIVEIKGIAVVAVSYIAPELLEKLVED
jgi:transcription antitermination factor NusG